MMITQSSSMSLSDQRQSKPQQCADTVTDAKSSKEKKKAKEKRRGKKNDGGTGQQAGRGSDLTLSKKPRSLQASMTTTQQYVLATMTHHE